MQPLRMGLVGAGAFGRNHARKIAGSPRCRLVAVLDADPARAFALAAEFGGAAVADLDELASLVDAVVVVSPAGTHAASALPLLRAGRHVLVEKPLATTLADADALIEAAAKAGVVLQVGHLERFQAAAGAFIGLAGRLRYLEARREGVWNPRGTDVSVVLDLMIHDIDLALQMAGALPVRIEASGFCLASGQHDWAQARLDFASGFIANLTASRVSPQLHRSVLLWSEAGEQVQVDLVGRRLKRVAPGLPPAGGEPPGFGSEEREWQATDALEAEHGAFLASILDGAPVVVPGQAGRDALAVGLAVMERIDAFV